VGSFSYNQNLSNRRARAVANYLVEKGIGKSRLSVTGMSEGDPVALNRTRDNKDAPEGRELNRRAQFKVTTQVDVIIEMEEIDVPDYLMINK
jgi:outer membrane protein OmpA-like peptidoglycan-associated protein